MGFSHDGSFNWDYCPIRSAIKPEKDSVLCDEKCAWFDLDDRCCVVVATNNRLASLESRLNRIIEAGRAVDETD